MRTKITFGQILTEQRGIGPGFDYLRIGLALAIFLAHISAVGGTRGIIPSIIDVFREIFNAAPISLVVSAHVIAPVPGNVPDMGLAHAGLSRPIVLSHVPMFFALSGFLVAGSAFRVRSVKSFLALRALRIFPALCVEVVLSAFLIGACVTVLPLDKYFQDHGFLTYLGNIFGFVQMNLPGVVWPSSGEPTAVNANLWTLPGEFYCYLILSIGMFSTLVFNRKVCTALFIVTTIGLIYASIFRGYHSGAGILATDLNVYYFFVGIMFFLWKDVIWKSWGIFALSIVATYLLIDRPWGIYLAPVPLAYVTVFIGLITFPSIKWLRSGDYSYGVYLYGFPISQMVLYEFPQLKGHYFALMAPSLALTIAFAYFSWHGIEKHALKLKRHFVNRSHGALMTNPVPKPVMQDSAVADTQFEPVITR